MNTLYILGNGFDLHHGLQTKYCHFQSFLKTENPELYQFIENYFDIQTDSDLLWNNFEEDLGTFDYDLFFSDHNEADPLDEDFKPSDFFGVEDELNEISGNVIDELREAFYRWISEVEVDCEAKFKFKEGAFFINFNYTNMLQKVYEIPDSQILHIHGEVNSGANLIFGHNMIICKEDELDENGDSNRSPMTDSRNASMILLNNFLKPVNEIIENHADIFRSITSTTEVFVLGHSLNDIDLDYFIEVQKNAKNAIWHCSYYLDEERDTFIRKLRNIGIEKSNVTIVRMEDF